MIIYLVMALSLVGTHGYVFYKGYNYANKDAIIKQQTAKLKYIDITRTYYRNADKLSKDEANRANEALAVASAKLSEIESLIQQGKLGKACSDKLFDELRKIK